MTECWGRGKTHPPRFSNQADTTPTGENQDDIERVFNRREQKKTHKYSMMRPFLAVGNQGREIKRMINITHNMGQNKELKSLILVQDLQQYPCFKTLESFLPSGEEFVTAKDVLNLLLSAPEERKKEHTPGDRESVSQRP